VTHHLPTGGSAAGPLQAAPACLRGHPTAQSAPCPPPAPPPPPPSPGRCCWRRCCLPGGPETPVLSGAASASEVGSRSQTGGESFEAVNKESSAAPLPSFWPFPPGDTHLEHVCSRRGPGRVGGGVRQRGGVHAQSCQSSNILCPQLTHRRRQLLWREQAVLERFMGHLWVGEAEPQGPGRLYESELCSNAQSNTHPKHALAPVKMRVTAVQHAPGETHAAWCGPLQPAARSSGRGPTPSVVTPPLCVGAATRIARGHRLMLSLAPDGPDDGDVLTQICATQNCTQRTPRLTSLHTAAMAFSVALPARLSAKRNGALLLVATCARLCAAVLTESPLVVDSRWHAAAQPRCRRPRCPPGFSDRHGCVRAPSPWRHCDQKSPQPTTTLPLSVSPCTRACPLACPTRGYTFA
jgi:hypothetical protein